MAILSTCAKCRTPFSQMPDDCEIYCDECSGKNAAARAEEERWAALPVEEKCNELRQMIIALRRETSYRDMRL